MLCGFDCGTDKHTVARILEETIRRTLFAAPSLDKDDNNRKSFLRNLRNEAIGPHE